jgi:hypothetical protein
MSAMVVALSLLAAPALARAQIAPAPVGERPAPPVAWVFELGGDFGTTALYTVVFADGSKGTGRANTGAFLSAGISILPLADARLRTRATFGVKATGVKAENGNVDYYAFPLEVVETLDVQPFRLAAGLYALLGPEVKGTGVASNITTRFDNTAGFTARAEWVWNRQFGIGVRFVWNQLSPHGQTLNAPAFGFVLSANGWVGDTRD